MADPLANQCTDARIEKVHQAFDLLLLLQREIPGQLVSTFLYIASHNGCHKQALEQELGFTTASSSRNTDWLSDGRMGVKHKGLGSSQRSKTDGDKDFALHPGVKTWHVK